MSTKRSKPRLPSSPVNADVSLLASINGAEGSVERSERAEKKSPATSNATRACLNLPAVFSRSLSMENWYLTLLMKDSQRRTYFQPCYHRQFQSSHGRRVEQKAQRRFHVKYPSNHCLQFPSTNHKLHTTWNKSGQRSNFLVNLFLWSLESPHICVSKFTKVDSIKTHLL